MGLGKGAAIPTQGSGNESSFFSSSNRSNGAFERIQNTHLVPPSSKSSRGFIAESNLQNIGTAKRAENEEVLPPSSYKREGGLDNSQVRSRGRRGRSKNVAENPPRNPRGGEFGENYDFPHSNDSRATKVNRGVVKVDFPVGAAEEAATLEDTTQAVAGTVQKYSTSMRTKVSLRWLPPSITESELFESFDAKFLPQVNWSQFVQGKPRKEFSLPETSSRCYLNFDSPKAAEEFIKAYHGHMFLSDQQESYRAVACMAGYQKVPKKDASDYRENTYTEDKEYKRFLEIWNNRANPSDPVLYEQKNWEDESIKLADILTDDSGVFHSPLLLALHSEYSIPTWINGKEYTYEMLLQTLENHQMKMLKNESSKTQKASEEDRKGINKEKKKKKSPVSDAKDCSSDHPEEVKSKGVTGENVSAASSSAMTQENKAALKEKAERSSTGRLPSELKLFRRPQPQAPIEFGGIWKTVFKRPSGDAALNSKPSRLGPKKEEEKESP